MSSSHQNTQLLFNNLLPFNRFLNIKRFDFIDDFYTK